MFLRAGELTVHVQVAGPEAAPPLLLLHSLGTSAHVWDAQAEALATKFRVVRPDMRGHGLTSVAPGPYSLHGLADDALAVLDALGIAAAHVAGLSIGGAIAQALAARAPARVRSLILCGTAMVFPTEATWRERAALVRAQGTEAIVGPTLGRWVTEDFLSDPAADGLRAMLRRTDREGYAAAAEALAVGDLTASTSALHLPALVLVGEHDPSTPPEAARALAAAIPGASLTVLPGAAHIPTVQTPAAVTAAMRAFLAALPA
jgi:3-oxoadipate enol-lactonase / 4-carboxymuconolactone decarboxylase